MEPLSDLIALLKPQESLAVGLNAAGAWALRYPALDGIKLMAATQGGCWLRPDGGGDAHRLEEGDCAFVTAGRSFVAASELSVPVRPAETAYGDDCIGVCNEGGESFFVGAHFFFAGAQARALLEGLPAIVLVGRASDQASVLRWSLERFEKELRERSPGGSLVMDHLAHIMLVQVLRLHLTCARSTDVGFLFAHTDLQLSPAVGAIHADVSRRWSLEELSRIAGMSRSSFASRFKKVSGMTPMDYLARWRVQVAAERLRTTAQSVGRIANSVGYESEAAFSRAFKTATGQSPKHHRRAADSAV